MAKRIVVTGIWDDVSQELRDEVRGAAARFGYSEESCE